MRVVYSEFNSLFVLIGHKYRVLPTVKFPKSCSDVTGAQVHGHTGPDWRRDPSERELGGGSRCVGSCGALRLPHCNTHTLCSQHHALPHATVHATHLALLHVQIWRRNWRWGGRRRSGFWEGRKKEGGSCEIRSSRASGIMSVDMLYTHTRKIYILYFYTVNTYMCA